MDIKQIPKLTFANRGTFNTFKSSCAVGLPAVMRVGHRSLSFLGSMGFWLDNIYVQLPHVERTPLCVIIHQQKIPLRFNKLFSTTNFSVPLFFMSFAKSGGMSLVRKKYKH